ncbi:MAG TPA: C4-dicarboxylate ABC transporter permease, partial [Pusillimonas sp.]|nr:C4-dicarboxylate ABC transporter permease [Pusillimonas sp.]
MTFFVFALLLLLQVPIGICLCLTAVFYIWTSGNTVLFESYSQQLFGSVESYGLLAIPLFILAGELMNEGGLTRRLINFARVFFGGFRGGLAYINLLANMMMASIMGSANAQIAIMSRAMVPEMEREGYDKTFSTAVTAAAG